jgi:hypothetical protein
MLIRQLEGSIAIEVAEGVVGATGVEGKLSEEVGTGFGLVTSVLRGKAGR